MATADKLTTVAENVPKVYHAGQMNVVENAECLKGSKTDTAILLDDISPVAHEMGVKVRRKNLFDINGFINLTGNSTYYGINDNGELYVKQSDYRDDTVIPAFITLEAGTYTLSSTTAITSSFKLINLTDNKVIAFNNNITFSIEKVTSLGIKCYQSADTVIGKPQLELGTTPTAYTPYVPDLTAVKVSRCGKNLIPFPYRNLKLGTTTINGIDFTVYEDGSILINGTSTSNTTRYLYNNVTDLLGLKPGITISGSKNASDDTQQANVYFMCNYYDSTGTMQAGIQASTIASGKKTITDDWKGLGIYINIPKGKTLNNLLIKPQLEIGTTATEYEPYITPTEYTPSADGTVEGVTSLYPNTTLTTDTDGVIIDCNYYKDIDKAYNKLSAQMALSGGE